MLIHEMLEETAKRYPQNIAVKHGEETITFEELNKQSTKLATFFDSKGIKEGDRIALVAKKSIESVVSIFGILKAGAMYVPIDPSIPKERLGYILKDCGVNIVLTSLDIIVGGKLIIENVIFIHDLYYHIESVDNRKRNIEINKDASAYIIYTSGSTREPKGVEIYHHSVTNLMEWYIKEFNITTKDKILSFVPFWFDASICDLFSMAKTGATLVLPLEGINMFPNEFAQFLVDERISLFFAPSSQFVLALDALKELKYPHLKTVMFGAEELPVKYVRELQEVFNGCALVNIYGPTECTDIATFYRVSKETLEDMKRIPIGKPYSSIFVEVVNRGDWKLCAPNEFGEIVISGDNTMVGYWNNNEATDNVFVLFENSLRYMAEGYLTGDIGYKDNDGNIVYVGRRDRMIKSMGRRIQLEEIEYVLNEHPLVKEAVVTSEQDVNVESRIVIECYVVPLAPLIEGEIIRYCRMKLPDYMVPTIVYICNSLPKTGTGKINRNIK